MASDHLSDKQSESQPNIEKNSPVNTITERLVLIDGKSVFYRGYYAMGALSLADGTPTGGVYGFAAIAMEIVKKLDPTKVILKPPHLSVMPSIQNTKLVAPNQVKIFTLKFHS